MNTHWGIRRFLRFRLRSLFLFILAVAVWLGYEVHQVRTVERQAEVIRALGGDVEFDFGGWTWLGSYEPDRYGRRIVTATIPVDATQEAIEVLSSASALRGVRLLQDGSADLGPFLGRVNSQWPEVRVTVSGSDVLRMHWPASQEVWEKSKARQRYSRFYHAAKESVRPPRRVLAALERLLAEGPQFDSQFDAYRLIPLRDGSRAELLVVSRGHSTEAELILLIADSYVDARYIDGSRSTTAVGGLEIEDLNGDGSFDVGVLGAGSYDSGKFSQPWLAQYVIEATGFRNVLGEDPFQP